MFIPKPLFIEISNESILMKVEGELDILKSEGYSFIVRPSGKIIKTKASDKRSMFYEKLSLKKEDEKKDLFLLKDLINRACKGRVAIVKKVLIWNLKIEASSVLLEQIERLSVLCDARETVILKQNIELDRLNINKINQSSIIGNNTEMTSPIKSLIVLASIIIGFLVIIYYRL